MAEIRPLSKVPTDFTKIIDLTEIHPFNIFCKVEAVYDWVQSKGEDFVLTLRVSDETCEYGIFVKCFRRKPTFLHGFFKGDTIKIYNIRYLKTGFYLLDKEGNIEVVSSNREAITEDLKETIITENPKKHCLRQIKDLQYPEYIRFTGILIYKQKESDNITILGFIDYTINPHIKKSENKAFYDNNMILYVKAWDKMAVKALELEEQQVYTLENLRVKMEITKIGASLSENVLSKITKITDQAKIDEIKHRSPIIEETVVTFSELIYNSIPLIKIKEIKDPGHYKIQVKILRHHPFAGHFIDVCTLCGIAQEASIFKCECGSQPERFFLVKYLVKDDSGECVLICKNDVARNMLSRCVMDRKIELLVYCDFRNDKLFIEVKDVPNFVVV